MDNYVNRLSYILFVVAISIGAGNLVAQNPVPPERSTTTCQDLNDMGITPQYLTDVAIASQAYGSNLSALLYYDAAWIESRLCNDNQPPPDALDELEQELYQDFGYDCIEFAMCD